MRVIYINKFMFNFNPFKFDRVNILIVLVFLSSCQQVSHYSKLIKTNEWNSTIVSGHGFNHLLVDNLKPTAEFIHIYIEGDGKPLNYLGDPSIDPTPEFPLTLALMSRDKAHSFYIGRPCYFQVYSADCNQDLWTEGRYSEPVVNSLSKVVSDLSSESNRSVVLIGFSGGGALAALIANRNSDVSILITINGNLDLLEWTKYHGTIPLTNSLNPISEQSEINNRIRKIFLVGEKDAVVPRKISQHYVNKHGGELVEYADFSHVCCWLDIWSDIFTDLQIP